MLPLNPLTTSSGSATITVNEPSHGRTSGDTVVFRDIEAVGGIAATTLASSSGFTITVTSANNYTFEAGTIASFTEIGGGGSVSAGPVTITP